MTESSLADRIDDWITDPNQGWDNLVDEVRALELQLKMRPLPQDDCARCRELEEDNDLLREDCDRLRRELNDANGGNTMSGFMYWFFPSVILGIIFWAWVLW